MSPVEIAKRLAIDPKTLRSWLRRNFARALDAHGTHWELTPQQVGVANAHFEHRCN